MKHQKTRENTDTPCVERGRWHELVKKDNGSFGFSPLKPFFFVPSDEKLSVQFLFRDAAKTTSNGLRKFYEFFEVFHGGLKKMGLIA